MAHPFLNRCPAARCANTWSCPLPWSTVGHRWLVGSAARWVTLPSSPPRAGEARALQREVVGPSGAARRPNAVDDGDECMRHSPRSSAHAWAATVAEHRTPVQTRVFLHP